MNIAIIAVLLWSSVLTQIALEGPLNFPEPKSGEFTARSFRFKSGQQMDVRIHYSTLGTPVRGAQGRVKNAALILHGTGVSGKYFLGPTFGGQLFCAGCLLDASKYFIILPDNVGHGDSSKPSDGMRMSFPRYDYDDMVALQHALLVDIGIDHLRLVMGTSMGCMHTWLWTETYPDFMDAAMPLACLPVEIAGRNRIRRKLQIDGIKADPSWNNGNYKEEPQMALRTVTSLEIIALSTPQEAQRRAPTRELADQLVEQRMAEALKTLDANDVLYQWDSSRNYNPEPNLNKIEAPVLAVNFADDFVNPPELGILESEIKHVKRGRAVVIPTSEATLGHTSFNNATLWGNYLQELLQQSGGLVPGTSWSPPIPTR